MLPQRIASRYLFSRKSHSIINIISIISAIAIAIPVMAMVVILSFHNGLNDYIKKLYLEFDPDIRIISSTGRDFSQSDVDIDRIKALPGVEGVSEMVEGNVLLMMDGYEHIATLRGVDSAYHNIVPIEKRIKHGNYTLKFGGGDNVLLGRGIAYALRASVSVYSPVEVYAMLPDQGSSVLMTKIYRMEQVQPTGIYELDEQNDSQYIFSGIDFARRLLGKSGMVSSLEIKIAKGANVADVQRELQSIMGDGFSIKSRFQQKETVYKVVNQEKWIIYLLLMMVILIASLSLAGAVVMLIAEKKNEISTLRTMGATTFLIRSIFLRQGVMISLAGIIAGGILGAVFALIQQEWGIIKMAGSSFLMESYPARLEVTDIAIIGISVLLLGLVISTVATMSVIKKDKFTNK